MIYYPVYLDLRNRRCVLVGGGTVGYRKALKLIEAGADLTIISPELTPELTSLAQDNKFTYINRPYQSGDLDGAFIAITATSDIELNSKVFRDARCPINVVDMPEYCSFIVPSTIQRGYLNIAVSTSGVSPALARTIRIQIEEFINRTYSDNLGSYLLYLKDFREKILSLKLIKEKREFILKFAGSLDALILLQKHGVSSIRQRLEKFIAELVD
ncbi:MAG: bifunctional precorrin-2 dehydrogenase/sirohydrochlorin ferrochelatase [Nitrospirae bacterium]|nr:bifunctional precorrin-2 dehydrogenase/sirohydrochlorin ferrochelatase [Nitrospirota bacterium]